MSSNNSLNNQALNGFTASGGDVNISADALAANVNVATGSAAKQTHIGSSNTTSTTFIQSGPSGSINLNTYGGSINTDSAGGQISLDSSVAATINIGGIIPSVKTITLGSTNSTSSTTVQSGSGALNITATNGALTINSGTGALGISTDASATTISIGTGSAVKGITIGSTNTTSTTTLTSGTGGVQVATFLNLPTTTSTVGQIKINGSPVLHSYGTSNIFVGGAGNFTNTGSNNIGIGSTALAALTSAQYNTAIGAQALLSYNSAGPFGANMAIGAGSMYSLTSGAFNTGVGNSTFHALVSGSYNVGIGINAGLNYTGAESSNILFNTTGVLGESNVCRIGDSTGTGNQQLNKTFVHGIYGTTSVGTTLSVPMIDNNGQLATASPNSSTVSLSTDATATTANLFTGNAVKTVTIGSTNTTSTTTLTSGTGGVQVGTFLNLPTTSSTVGQIKINSNSFLHAYGTNNTFIGSTTGNFSLTGTDNVGIGYGALTRITTGSWNLCIGSQSGFAYTSSESNNILIGAGYGAVGESNVLRIGAATGTGIAQLNKAIINGIRGITTVNADAIAVLIDSAGQLGTVSSSIRYKENVVDMGDVSSPVMNLRPVTFDFIGKPSHKKQVGLIAEEVEQIMPSLVAYNSEGEVESVKYHDLPVLLLNELQKLHKRIEILESKIK